jgi:hypothetical protein
VTYNDSHVILGDLWRFPNFNVRSKGHLTHETESPWPLHFKHSHWWKRHNWSKFAPHHAWGTNGGSECKMDVKSTWIPTWYQMDHVNGHLDYFQKRPLGGRPNTELENYVSSNAHNCWFILFYHVWGPAWIEIHWNSIWLRVWSHVMSHYTWGPVTTLCKFGGVLGQPLARGGHSMSN